MASLARRALFAEWMGRIALGASIGALVLGCRARDRADVDSQVDDPIPTPSMLARRPTARFYLERTTDTDRCAVYSLDGDSKSPSEDFPCPQDLAIGERLRIAGMTCIRESSAPARELPVVCPDSLTNFEKAYRKAHLGQP